MIKKEEEPVQPPSNYQHVLNQASFKSAFSSQSLDGNNLQVIIHESSDQEFEKQYQYNQKKFVTTQKAKTSSRAAAMTLMKAYIGSGVLALPYAFSQGGWLLSTFIFLLSCSVLLVSIRALLEVAEHSKQDNIELTLLKQTLFLFYFVQKTSLIKLYPYQLGLSEFAGELYGTKGIFVTRLFLISYQIGKSIAYLIFFIQFFSYVFSDAQNEQETGNFIYLILALCIVIPMGFIDNMALFTKFSIAANILTWFGLISVIGFSMDNMINGGHFKENISNLANFDQFPMVIGVSVFSMGIVPIIFPIRNSMHNVQQFSQLFELLTKVTITICLSFCILGVWGYGRGINQIILFSLQAGPYASFVQVCYAIALISTYPLQLLPGFQQIEKFQFLKKYINPEIKYSRLRRLLIRSIINIAMGFVAYGIPQFAYFINILGAIGGAFINYLLPMILHYKMFKGKDQALKKSTYVGTLLFGVIGGGCAFIYSVVKLTNSK